MAGAGTAVDARGVVVAVLTAVGAVPMGAASAMVSGAGMSHPGPSAGVESDERIAVAAGDQADVRANVGRHRRYM